MGNHGSLRQLPHYEQAVYLVGAFVYLGDAGVAVAHFQARLYSVAHTAMDLDGLIGSQADQLRAFYLDYRSFDGKLADCFDLSFAFRYSCSSQLSLLGVNHRRGAEEGGFIGKGMGSKLPDFMLDGPKLGDGLAKLPPLKGILYRFVNRKLRATDAASPGFNAAAIEDIERDLEALLALSQQVFSRHRAIVEVQLHRRGAFDAHLLLLRAGGEARVAPLHDKSRKVLVLFDFGKDDEHIGKTAIGNPDFLAVEQIVMAIGAGGSGGFARIGI